MSSGAPQGNNKIYRSDEVFLIEKNNKSDTNKTQIPYRRIRTTWYSPLVKPEESIKAKRRYLKIPTNDVVFLMEEARKKNAKLLLRDGGVEWVGCQRGVEAEAED